jgi:hypothetical protein
VIKLPQPVDVTQIAVDPGAICGHGASASTGAFRIETSTDGVVFTESSTGVFASDGSDNGHLNVIPMNAGTGDNVQYVKFWIGSPNIPGGLTSCPGPLSGCQFMDVAEIEVHGTAS